jgi:iron complex transport system permease protein
MFGSRTLSVSEVLEALRDPSSTHAAVVWGLRIPRTIVAIMVGAAFAVAGALIQAVSRNPLAEPGILGVSAGAGLAVTLAAALLGVTSTSGAVWFAFGGALLATVAVLVIGAPGRTGGPARLLLAGVALAAVLSGISTWVALLDSTTFTAVRNWALGTVVVTDLSDARTVGVFLAVGVVVALACGPGLNVLAFGDDLATALGARAALTRGLAVLAITLLAGGATALTGGIAFVGLMVPHLMRWVVGPDQRWIMATCLLGGPVLVLTADIVGRLVAAPGEIEVGVVTAVIGAPLLVVMVRRLTVSEL